MTGLSEQQLAEIDRLRDRVAELETYAYGCDAEGCVIPHSSWCEPAKKCAAENDGCTCGKPWKGHPQPHAMHCWAVNPPRNEVEEMRKRIAELLAERHSTNEALSKADEALRDANTAAGLVAEYHVPAADGQWLAVRREPNGDRWAIYTAGHVLGDRKTWTGDHWISIALATDSELWNYASADAALAEATRLAEAGGPRG